MKLRLAETFCPKNLMEGTREKAKEILATHQLEPLHKSVKEQLKQIIEEAWKREQRRS